MAAAPKIALRKLSALKPDPRNARTHSAEQIEQIAGSIERFGWTNPVLADDLIRAGHGRCAAAHVIYRRGGRIYMAPGKERGGVELPDGTVPVIDCTGWSEDERKAYGLADNQIALLAGWDEQTLAESIRELIDIDFDMRLVGFDTREMDRLLAGLQQEPVSEDPPAAPENPVSRQGDIWILGGHRIACGSSTDSETVDRLLAGAVPHLMVTDPPYGVAYDPEWRNRAAADGLIGQKKATRATGQVLNDDRADWTEAWALFPGDVAYVWHGGVASGVVSASLIATGFDLRAQIIWNKNNIAIGRGDYHWKHEPCWYAVRKGAKAHWNGSRKESTVWDIDKPMKSETGHGTQKPLECMRRPVLNNSKMGDSVYEPFSGSGTTLIVCEEVGRHCYAVELNEAYVDVAVLRWQALTGLEAVLEGDGRTYAEIAAQRLELEPAE